MSRHKKTFAPRVITLDGQAQDYSQEEESKYERISNQDATILLTRQEATKITYVPFKNQAFKKIENGRSIIKISNKGPYVQVLNKALQTLGYKVSGKDDFFWSDTQYALVAFQRDYGIKASAVFDATTLLKMDEVLEDLKNKDAFKELAATTEQQAETDKQQKTTAENQFSASTPETPFVLYLIDGEYHIYLNVTLPKPMYKGKDEVNAAIYYYQSAFGYSEQKAKLIIAQLGRSFILYRTYEKEARYNIKLDYYIQDLYFERGLSTAEINEIIAEIISKSTIITGATDVKAINISDFNKLIEGKQEDIETRKNTLREYIANIEQLDPALLKNYLDGDNEDEFIKALGHNGLSESYIEDFLSLFRSEVNRKSLQMLDKNEALLKEVQEFYKDEDKLDELVGIVKGASPALESALGGYANSIIPFFRNFIPKRALPRNEKVKKEYLQLIEIYGGEKFDAFLGVLGNITTDQLGIYEEGSLINDLRNNDTRDYILNTPSFFANYISLIAAHADELDDAFIFQNPAVKEIKKQTKRGDFEATAYLNNHYPELNQSVEKYKTVLNTFQSSGKAQEHIVLKDLTLNFNKLTFLNSKQAIKDEIKNIIYTEKPQNIASVREKIADDPDFLWAFSPVIEKVMNEYGIIGISNTAGVIHDKIGEEAFDRNLLSLIIAGLSLVLAVAGFFTAGISTLAAGALALGSVGLSLTDLVIEYNKYKDNTAASNTSLSGRDELADLDQSLLPVILSAIALGIDFAAAFGALRAVKLGRNIEKNALLLFRQLKSEGKLVHVTEEAFMQNLKQYKGFSRNLERITDKKFLRFLDAVGEEQSSLIKVGLYNLEKNSPEVFKAITEVKDLDVVFISRLSTHMAVNPGLSKGIDNAFKLLGRDVGMLNKVMVHFSGAGNKFIDDLPEFVNLVQGSNAAKYPKLTEELLGDYRYLNTVLNNSDEGLETLNAIAKRWESYLKSKREVSFSEFLRRGGNGVSGINISITKTTKTKTVAEFFEGQADILKLFTSATEHSKKNLALWEITEPSLVKAYKSKTLPASVEKAIDGVVETNLIGSSGLNSGLANTRGKVVEAMNKAIGGGSSIADIRKLDELDLISQQASRGSIFEEWVRFNHAKGTLGADEWGKLSGKLSFSAEELKSLNISKGIIGDAHYLEDGSKILIEFKHTTGKLSGEPLEQMLNYKKLIDKGKIDEVEYVFSTLEAANSNKAQIQKIFIQKDLYKISYINEAGKKIAL